MPVHTDGSSLKDIHLVHVQQIGKCNLAGRAARQIISAPPCIGPPDARIALLPSPVLPAAEVVVATKKPGVHRPTIHAAEEPDILTLEKHRTFPLWLDANFRG